MAILIAQADGQTIKLGFGRVVDLDADFSRAANGQPVADTTVESRDFVLGKGIVQRQHRCRMRERRKLGQRRRTDALRRRIDAQQFRMFGLERLQLGEQVIVFGITDQRRVAGVILDVVPLDRRPQGLHAIAGTHRGTSGIQENRRCASGPPAGSLCAAIAAWNCSTC
jgi:hypothetical protein